LSHSGSESTWPVPLARKCTGATIQRRDRELTDAVNNPRRSVAVQQLTVVYANGLLSEAEFARFSAETRGAVETFLAIVRD
jgi:hypothetical protein